MSQHAGAQPIAGSWFEFQHHNRAEGVYWNSACARFDAAAWHAKVGEMAAIGLEYLVLMAVALDFKTFYPSRLLPAWEMACPDPLEALLQAADDHGIKVFVGNGFWGQWDSPGIVADAQARTRRLPEAHRWWGRHRRVERQGRHLRRSRRQWERRRGRRWRPSGRR